MFEEGALEVNTNWKEVDEEKSNDGSIYLYQLPQTDSEDCHAQTKSKNTQYIYYFLTIYLT